jgi:hypothetical protein
MTAHLADRSLLSQLIRLAEMILAAPLTSSPARMFDLDVLSGDLLAALRCPGGASHVGAAEGILSSALQQVAKGGAISTGELYRYAFIAQQVLPMVRDHYFDAVVTGRGARP